ncbi:winged helix-turn-helix transcriptional regulator [Micromonospora globbae]|jgi:DNA-binding HxlR family transcriptional regulator|uniref:Helix-turn-helix transcriptional regulator n=1 Tax=Micromonospora globbae TaxID=1894969 RepID=A0ABZ1SBP0_9ACTN|nr:helix-turn-helix domain-containing protein [Micromonospora globbae]WTF88898.1 helix-turn-helix transcriptional regulator [Micromonospora globbae]
MVTSRAAARRTAARAAYLTSMAACPTHRVLDRMGERWVSLILKELACGPRRHGELARAVAGATQKMLTQTLRGLERDGLVARSVTGSVPPRVEYRLTPLGASLLPVLAVVTEWSERHIGDIDAARAAYDAGTPRERAR